MKNLVILTAFLGFLFTTSCSTPPPPKPKPVAKAVEVNPDANREFFADASFSYEFIRVLAATAYQGADIRECLDVAKQIKKGDFESWYLAWNALADRTRALASRSFNRDHQVSASEAFLRASTYYRAAGFYLHGNPDDSRIKTLWKSSHDTFLKSLAHSGYSVTPVQIPYETTSLPGYLYKVDQKRKPRPLLILQTGFDGTQEELYGRAVEGIKRGYNVLTFEGPGQGEVIQIQGLPMRADWEFVIRKVLDFAVALKTTKPDEIALYGIDLGGYLAARGAAYDHRIKALIVNPGIYDAMEGFTKRFNDQVHAVMAKRTNARWFFEQAMYIFKVKSPSEAMTKYSEFKMKDSIEMINAPTLVCESENEMEGFVGQAQIFFDHLKTKKTFLKFKMAEGGDAHVQEGSFFTSNQKVFDWLDEIFGK